jgi:hypothetical protein
MTWVLLKNTNFVKNRKNPSDHGRRKGCKLWNDTLKGLSDTCEASKRQNQKRSDEFLHYQDLNMFAEDLGFKWADPSVQVNLVGNLFEHHCFVLFPDEFRVVLRGVLADIAKVAKALGIHSNTELGTWPIPEAGWLIVHYNLAAQQDVNPRNFRELSFYFYKGGPEKDFHFYYWRMQYEDHMTLILTDKVAFTGVTKVSDSVWVVDRSDGRQAVIKYETCSQPAKGYERRYDYVQWLARKAFNGVPTSAMLTPEELEIVSRIDVQEVDNHGDGQRPTLATVAQLKLRGNQQMETNIFVKITPVQMGKNLEARIEVMKVALNRDQARDDLRTFFFDLGRLKEFGEIAIFDLIVTNYDRFSAVKLRTGEISIGLKNIDFTAAGRPFALDNVDPSPEAFNEERYPWPGQEHLASKKTQKAYARGVLQNFIRNIDSVEYYRTREPLVTKYEHAFYEGMRDGLKKLKNLRTDLQVKVRADEDDYGRQFGAMIDQRLYITEIK